MGKEIKPIAIHSTCVTLLNEEGDVSVSHEIDARSAYPKELLAEENITAWMADLQVRLNKAGHVKIIDVDVARYYYEKRMNSAEAAIAYIEIFPDRFPPGEG